MANGVPSSPPTLNLPLSVGEGRGEGGQATPTTILALLAIIVGGIWVWNHLDFDTQDFVVDEVVPILFFIVAVVLLSWTTLHKIRQRQHRNKRRAVLIQQFSREQAPGKRFTLATELIELNRYQLAGLEHIAPAMAEVFIATFRRSPGDKQHRIRGMAASSLGESRTGSRRGHAVEAQSRFDTPSVIPAPPPSFMRTQESRIAGNGNQNAPVTRPIASRSMLVSRYPL